MFLHHEAYRLLTYERMGRYLHEAAVDRQSRIASRTVGVVETPRRAGAAARIMRAVARVVTPNRRGGTAVCPGARRCAS